MREKGSARLSTSAFEGRVQGAGDEGRWPHRCIRSVCTAAVWPTEGLAIVCSSVASRTSPSWGVVLCGEVVGFSASRARRSASVSRRQRRTVQSLEAEAIVDALTTADR